MNSTKELLELINLEKAINIRKVLRKEKRVIPATGDIIFKNVMKNCPNYLSTILAYFLEYDKNTIKNNMYLEDVELPVSNAKEKKKVTDIIVRVGHNVINLEMNTKSYPGLIDRNVDYLSKMKGEAAFNGEKYIEVYKAIQLNFDLEWKYDERDIIKFLITDVEKGIIETENYQIYHINLPKLKEKYYNNDKLSEFERAVALLTLERTNDLEKISKGDDALMEAKEEIERLSNNLGIIGVYDYEKYKEWEWKQLAEKSIEEDKKTIRKDRENIEKDRENIEKDRENIEKDRENIEKDRKSIEEDRRVLREEKIYLATKMLAINFPVEDIIKTTGLSKKEIEELK